MFFEIPVTTHHQTELVEVTGQVQEKIRQSGVSEGICHLWVPHTTAAITVNEHADPSVVRDILMELNKIIPFQDNYAHLEGNSAAHIKSSVVGCSTTLIIHNGRLQLGTWQGVFFCEFDGPRHRKLWVKIIPDH